MDRNVPRATKSRPNALTWRPQRWNSRAANADQRGVPAALSPGLPRDREGDRERRPAARRPPARPSAGCATSWASAAPPCGARSRSWSPTASSRRRGRGSFVTGEALAEPPNTLMSLSELGRSRGLDASARVLGRATCAPRRSTRPRRSASPPAPSCSSSSGCACSTACRSRSTTTGVPLRCAPDAGGPRLHHRLAVRRARARAATPPAPRRLRARGPRRRRDGGGAAGAGAGCAGPVRHDGRDRRRGRVVDLGRTVYRADRYRFQATLMRRAHT